jgi:hypothetical protein
MSPEIVPNRLLMTDSGRAPYLEAPARAIAAVKRGKKPDDPEIDRVWGIYPLPTCTEGCYQRRDRPVRETTNE